MIRQAVDRHGNIRPLEPASSLPACNLSPGEVGVIKGEPVKKWMQAKQQWDVKYAKSKRAVQKQRAEDMARGYQSFGNGEIPPPSALAGRRKEESDVTSEKKPRSSHAMSLWSGWGSKHDKLTMDREQNASKAAETVTATHLDGAGARSVHDLKTGATQNLEPSGTGQVRRRSRHRSVVDEDQTGIEDQKNNVINGNTAQESVESIGTPKQPDGGDTSADEALPQSPIPYIHVNSPAEIDADLKRPKAGGIAFPFSLKQEGATASMTTLTSAVGVPPVEDMRITGVMTPGIDVNGSSSTPLVKSLVIDEKKVEELLGKEVEAPVKKQANGIMSRNGGTTGMLAKEERPPLETFVTAPEILPTIKDSP